MKIIKLIIFTVFFISFSSSQTYDEIIKLRKQYDQLKESQLQDELNNEGDFASVLIEYFELLMNLLRPDSKSLETLR